MFGLNPKVTDWFKKSVGVARSMFERSGDELMDLSGRLNAAGISRQLAEQKQGDIAARILKQTGAANIQDAIKNHGKDPALRDLLKEYSAEGMRVMKGRAIGSKVGGHLYGAGHYMAGGGDWKKGLVRSGTAAGVIGGVGLALDDDDD